MGDYYGNASYRKSKNDKKMKKRRGIYKKGGKYRATNVQENKASN